MKATRQAIVKLAEIEEGNRAREDYRDIGELIKSIKQDGLIQPLAVRENDNGKPYYLLAGGRRFRALTMMKQEDVPVNIYDASLSELDCKSIELAENLIRQDLNYAEEVKLKSEIHNLQVALYGEKTTSSPFDKGWNTQKTAELLGESQANISRDLSLANAIEKFPELAKQKDKAQAQKKFRKMKQQATTAEIVARIEAKASATPLEQIKQELANAYKVQSFFEGIKDIPDNSIHVIEMDPPYGINLQGQKMYYNSTYSTDSYNEIEAALYPEFITNALMECYRVLRPDGWIVVWFGPDPWFSLFVNIMKKIEFRFMSIPGIWVKGVGQTNKPDRYLGRNHEMFFYATKENGIIVNQGRSDVFEYRPVTGTKKVHPTERPIELMQDILRTFAKPGDNVLVPFAGSGATLLASANLRMVPIGFDLNEDYRNSYIVRVMQSDPLHYSSYNKPTAEGV